MKKIFNFILSIALLGNLLCSTVALAETDSTVKKQVIRTSYTTVANPTDPDTDPLQ